MLFFTKRDQGFLEGGLLQGWKLQDKPEIWNILLCQKIMKYARGNGTMTEGQRNLDSACPCANLGQFKNQNKYNRLQPVK